MSMAKSVTDLLTLKMKNIKMAMVLSTMLNRKDGLTEKRDTMKKFEEIVNEIKVLSGEMKDTENEIETEKENHSKYFDELFEGLSLYEKVKKARTHEEYQKKTEEHNLKISELGENLTFKKLKQKVLYHNARTSLFFEVFPTIIEVWNKYEGKRHGEKTSEKIRDEICERTNCRIYLTGYKNDTIVINHKDYYFGHFYEVKAYLKYDHNMLIDNVIQNVSMDDFQTEKKYIDDVDKYVEELIIAYNKAQLKRKELEDVYSEFNKMTVDGIEHLYMAKTSYGIV